MTQKVYLKIRAGLKKAADPVKAPQMQAYMKSEMPYYGVQAPSMRAVCREVFTGLTFDSADDWMREVAEVWDKAKFREERYAAIELSGHKNARAFQSPGAVPLYEKLIVEGAWWDLVDWIATNRVSPILKSHPSQMRKLMLRWSKSDNIWKRRTAILSQLKFGADTDLEFLVACIRPSLGSKEFFLQKAIGWALRSYAWTNPKAVVKYVKKNEKSLAPLSRREALKNV